MQRSKKFPGMARTNGWRWVRVILPFLVVVAMLVWLLTFSMNILPAVRAFVGGENHPDYIDSIISLYRNFKNFSLLAEPLRIWRVGDELLQQLGAEPSRLHAVIQSGQRPPHQGNRRSDNAAGTGFFCQSWRIFEPGAALAAADDADHCCCALIEEALKISEERLQLAILGSNDGLWGWDIQADNISRRRTATGSMNIVAMIANCLYGMAKWNGSIASTRPLPMTDSAFIRRR